jgi:hypothetical protein
MSACERECAGANLSLSSLALFWLGAGLAGPACPALDLTRAWALVFASFSFLPHSPVIQFVSFRGRIAIIFALF